MDQRNYEATRGYVRSLTADAVGAPVDTATNALNLAIAMAGYLGHKSGLLKTPPDLITNPVGGSDWFAKNTPLEDSGSARYAAGRMAGTVSPIIAAIAKQARVPHGQVNALPAGFLSPSLEKLKSFLQKEGSELVFRSTHAPGIDVRVPRKEYAAFATENPYLASNYVRDMEQGAVYPLAISPSAKMKEFSSPGRFDAFKFDETAKRLGANEILRAKDIVDSAPHWYYDPFMRSTFRSDQYAWKDPSVVDFLDRSRVDPLAKGVMNWKQEQYDEISRGIRILQEGLRDHPPGVKKTYKLPWFEWDPYDTGARAELERLLERQGQMGEMLRGR